MTAESQRDFVNRFNRLVGDKTGRSISVPRPRPTLENRNPSRTARRVNSGAIRLSGDTRENYEAAFGDTRNRRSAEQSFTQAMDRAITAQDSLRENTAEIEQAYQDAYDSGDNFSTSAVGRVLDVLSRGAFALNEGMRSSAESQNNGDGFFGDIDDVAAGLWRGLSGQAKTGFGDSVEEVSQGDSFVGQQLQNLEENNPEASKWLQRGLGLAGDLTLDPLNLVSGGSVGVIRNSGGRLTTEAAMEAAEAAARRATANVPIPHGRVGATAVNVADEAAAAARSSIDRAALEITRGPLGGRTRLGRGTEARTVGNAVAANVRAGRLSSFERKFNQFIGHIETLAVPVGKRTPAQQARLLSRTQLQRMRRDPLFADFLDNQFLSQFNGKHPVNAVNNANRAQQIIENGLTTGSRTLDSTLRMYDDAARATRETIDADIAKVYDDIVEELTGFYYNAPTIRLGGRDVEALNSVLRPIGRAWSKVGAAAGNNPSAVSGLNKLSYNALFPGRLANVGQKVRSVGVQEFEAIKKSVRAVAKTMSRQDAVRVQQVLETGIQTGNKTIDDAADFIRKLYNEMQDRELALGGRKAGTLGGDTASDYAFVYTRGGTSKARAAFKDARKRAVRASKNGDIPPEFKTPGAKNFTYQGKTYNLKPVENAFEAVLLKTAKHQRDMAQTRFLRDIIDHYGFVGTKLSDSAQDKLGVVELPRNKIADDIFEATGRDSHIYIPRELDQVRKHWEELAKLDGSELAAPIRALQTITNKFKTLVTLPFPGFHIRNMTFDFFMGTMDGVKPRAYMEVLDKWGRRKAGAMPAFKINDDITLTWDEAVDLFRKNGSSGGFYSVDLGEKLSTRTFGRAVDKARDISEMREDVGRFTHFIHALRNGQ